MTKEKEKEESASNGCTQGFDENTCPFRDTCSHIQESVEKAKSDTVAKIHAENMITRVVTVFVVLCLAGLYIWMH